jgi:putative intracellular protease/amidase
VAVAQTAPYLVCKGDAMTHSVLIVITSTGVLPDERETGFDWPSVAVPYWRLREAGVRVGFASIRGGKPPGDPATATEEEGDQIGAVSMFLSDERAVEALAHSHRLAAIDPEDWTAVLFAGGLGALWDMAAEPATERLAAAMWERGGVLAAIGAGAAALTVARDAQDHAVAAGRSVTCLPDEDVRAALEGEDAPVMPETRLRAQGARVWTAARGEEPHVIDDGRLITGQDGRAAAGVALQLLDALDIYAPAALREEAAEAEAGAPAPREDGEGPPAPGA